MLRHSNVDTSVFWHFKHYYCTPIIEPVQLQEDDFRMPAVVLLNQATGGKGGNDFINKKKNSFKAIPSVCPQMICTQEGELSPC